jgi:hypothetical protein
MVFSAKFLENVLQVITDTKVPENYEIKRKEYIRQSGCH